MFRGWQQSVIIFLFNLYMMQSYHHAITDKINRDDYYQLIEKSVFNIIVELRVLLKN